MSQLTLRALAGAPEIAPGTVLADAILTCLESERIELEDYDVITVTSKVVSKAEGRVVSFDGTDEHKIALIESESVRVLRRRGTLHIVETRHGFICANAGIDLSNTAEGTAVLLPVDPDKSARKVRGDLERATGRKVAVVVTDTFGRVWRTGVTDVAIGIAGLRPVSDLRGTVDHTGRTLEATEIAIADEIAGAAHLVLGKAAMTPFALVRGISAEHFGDASVAEHLVRRAHDDLFR
jgi:coenzyme F420-0:L-glutamate ligase/coenzyme F420-1:gamma-L-glutamate ligase